jgi:hypothetical protein
VEREEEEDEFRRSRQAAPSSAPCDPQSAPGCDQASPWLYVQPSDHQRPDGSQASSVQSSYDLTEHVDALHCPKPEVPADCPSAQSSKARSSSTRNTNLFAHQLELKGLGPVSLGPNMSPGMSLAPSLMSPGLYSNSSVTSAATSNSSRWW